VRRRNPIAVLIDETNVHVTWGPEGGSADLAFTDLVPVVLLPIARTHIAVIIAFPHHIIINRDHPMADWVRAAQGAVDRGVLPDEEVRYLLHELAWAAKGCDPLTFERWHGPTVPAELQPPPLVPIMPGVLGSPDPDDASTP
jgi:hypothetical protein